MSVLVKTRYFVYKLKTPVIFNKCCVPKCKSNYDSSEENHVTCFKFLSNASLKEKWCRKIPRAELKVSKHTVVCIKHFNECDIIRYDILPGKSGEPDIKIPRKKLGLKKDAFPCIFPNLPTYLSSSNPVRRSSAAKRRKLREAAHDALQEA